MPIDADPADEMAGTEDGSADCSAPRVRKRDKAKHGSKKLGMFCIQLAFLAGVCYVGNAVSASLPISIPGNICSMAILFALLVSGIIAEDKISLISNFLLKYMPFFFIPAGVTILTSLPLIEGRIPQFLLVCLLTTVIVFLATSFTVVLVTRLQKYAHAKRTGRDASFAAIFTLKGDPRVTETSSDEASAG
ncbi:MAG: CidA/LrgA family protein [Slackia sp.]|nr:CidA/LrgA family protein [Slackia sp.]